MTNHSELTGRTINEAISRVKIDRRTFTRWRDRLGIVPINDSRPYRYDPKDCRRIVKASKGNKHNPKRKKRKG